MPRKLLLIAPAIAIFLLPVNTVTLAQSQTPPPATTQTATRAPQVIRWERSNPNADSFIVNGDMVETLTHDGVGVWATVKLQKIGSGAVKYEKLVAYVGVINESGRRLDFDPTAFTLDVVKPKPKSLKFESAEHLARSIEKWTRFSAALGQAAASMETEQSTTHTTVNGQIYGAGGVTTVSGTATGTTTSPNYEARRRADARAREAIQDAEIGIARLLRSALLANTLLPGEDRSGMVIFDREKKAEELLLRVRVEGTVFEFPFVRGR